MGLKPEEFYTSIINLLRENKFYEFNDNCYFNGDRYSFRYLNRETFSSFSIIYSNLFIDEFEKIDIFNDKSGTKYHIQYYVKDIGLVEFHFYTIDELLKKLPQIYKDFKLYDLDYMKELNEIQSSSDKGYI